MLYERLFSAPVALEVAMITKLVRTLTMVFVIPVLAMTCMPAARDVSVSRTKHYLSMVPWFIAGVLVMSALRTLGDNGDHPLLLLSTRQWTDTIALLRSASEHCLLVAMAAVGVRTSLRGMASIGARPFALGLFAAVLIGAVSLCAIWLLRQFVGGTGSGI